MSGSDFDPTQQPSPYDQSGSLGLPSTQPGLGGYSPSFWQNIAALGAGAINGANARTADGHLVNGTGIAGGIAGAAQGLTSNVNQQAQLRSQLAHQGAQTQELGLKNELTQYQLPLAKAQAGFNASIYQDPAMQAQLRKAIQQAQGGDGAPSAANPYTSGNAFTGQPTPVQPGGATGFQSPLTPSIHQLESQSQVRPGIVGDGGSAGGPMQVHPQALADVNQAHGTNYTLPQITANPNLGIQVGDAYLSILQKRYPSNPAAVFAAYNAGPAATDRALQSPQGLGALPPSTQNYVSRGMQLAGLPYTPAPPLNLSVPPSAQTYAARAQLAGMGIPFFGSQGLNEGIASELLKSSLAGPTAGSVEAAKIQPQLAEKQGEADIALRNAGPIALTKAQHSNIDVRSNGLVGTFDDKGNRVWYKNPGVIETQDASGATVPMHASPAPPGSPPGTVGTAEPILGPDGKPVITKQPQNWQQAQNKAYEDFSGKDQDRFTAAANTQGVLTQMNEAARTLNKAGGLLGTGPLAPERIAFASKVNDILRSAGLKEAFDPNAVGSWEELTKATTTAGFELSSHYEGHSRQAATTIENATSAVPSAKNSPIGFEKVFSQINEQAQYELDLHNAKQPAYAQKGDIVNAETNFVNKFSPEMYARRAISNITPFAVDGASPEDIAKKFLPGTRVTVSGQPFRVPAIPGAPPIPDYIKNNFLTPGPAVPGGG